MRVRTLAYRLRRRLRHSARATRKADRVDMNIMALGQHPSKYVQCIGSGDMIDLRGKPLIQE